MIRKYKDGYEEDFDLIDPIKYRKKTSRDYDPYKVYKDRVKQLEGYIKEYKKEIKEQKDTIEEKNIEINNIRKKGIEWQEFGKSQKEKLDKLRSELKPKLLEINELKKQIEEKDITIRQLYRYKEIVINLEKKAILKPIKPILSEEEYDTKLKGSKEEIQRFVDQFDKEKLKVLSKIPITKKPNELKKSDLIIEDKKENKPTIIFRGSES